MIEEILETARLSQNENALHREKFAIGPLVEEVARDLAEVRGEGALELIADRRRIRSLLSNLIENARKYAPADAPVEVIIEDAGASLRISVRDRGIGISPEDLAHVMEPFYRADKSRVRETGGYGLGLSLSRKIVEAHGGQIRIDSREGAGTTVIVELPKG